MVSNLHRFFLFKWRVGISINVSAMEQLLAELQSLLEDENVDSKVETEATCLECDLLHLLIV